MRYENEDIIGALKAARGAKGLSQRDLSAKIGVPQSHISKIESGGSDLKLSSLIELARALDLELALVPHKFMPAVNGIIRNAIGQGSPKASSKVRRKMEHARTLRNRIADTTPEPPHPAYALDQEDDDA